MQTFFGVKVDISTMKTEDLEKARAKIQEMLVNKQHQIMTSHLACHVHSANNYLKYLKEEQNEIQEMLSNIEHQINARKIVEHRFAK